jgi:hypothetical protein
MYAVVPASEDNVADLLRVSLQTLTQIERNTYSSGPQVFSLAHGSLLLVDDEVRREALGCRCGAWLKVVHHMCRATVQSSSAFRGRSRIPGNSIGHSVHVVDTCQSTTIRTTPGLTDVFQFKPRPN